MKIDLHISNCYHGIEESLLDQAKKKGRKEGIKDIGIKMKIRGLDIKLITNVTGFSIEKVENLS